jgi:hypothetical protein
MKMRKLALLVVLLLLTAAFIIDCAYATPSSETLTPNADIDTGWTPNSGTTRYEAVQTDDGDNTYIYGQTAWTVQTFGLPDISPAGYAITSVTVYAVARKQAYNPVSFRINIWTHGYEYSSDDFGRTDPEVYSTSSWAWTTNPFTGKSWTISEVNDLQAGLEIRASGGTSFQVAVTHFYIVIEEVPEPVIPEYALGALLALAACFAAFVIIKRPHVNLRIR